MAITKSFQEYGTLPSAILSDGILTVPLWAVTTMTLTASYHLPPIGSTGAKSVVGTHDDTITLAGVLVGTERYAWKLAMESLAESSRRGSALASFTGGAAGGLVLITSMTIRTDMQVTSLTFTASAARRDALDVSIGMAHLPLPSALGKLLDVASVGVGALADLGGN
jgi:hypothetical protein